MLDVATIPVRNQSIHTESVSTLDKVVSSLAEAVDSLQDLQASNTNRVFRDLEINFPKDGIDFYEATRSYEINLIRQALRMTRGHQAKAASLLNLRTSTLNSIIKRHDIHA